MDEWLLDTVADFESGGDHDELRRKYQEALKKNDMSRTIVWAGTGVGLMDTVKPAKVSLPALIISRDTHHIAPYRTSSRSSIRTAFAI